MKKNNRLFATTVIAIVSLLIAGCSTIKAENFSISASVTEKFGLLANQPSIRAEVKLIGLSDQKVSLILQKWSTGSWVDISDSEINVEKSASKVFSLKEDNPGKYKYRISIRTSEEKSDLISSNVIQVQIDDLAILTRDLYYGEQQACGNGSRSECLDYKAKHQYPGLFNLSAYKSRMRFLIASYPEVNTLTPDPNWTITRRAGDPKYYLDISKPLPGDTYTVTVELQTDNSRHTVHVTYLEGKLYYYQW